MEAGVLTNNSGGGLGRSKAAQPPAADEKGKGLPVWREEGAARVRRAPLPGSMQADVAIVGAGFTGLWTAYYLLASDPSLRVVVLEKEHAGFGASGRNGGWCSAIFPVSLQRVASMSSRKDALALQEALNATVDEVGRVTRDENIDCHFSKKGFLSLARSPAQLHRAQRQLSATQEFGLSHQWSFLGQAQAREKVNANGVLGGLWTEHCAVVQPDLLVRGLARCVEDRGGRLFEGTPARRLDTGAVQTDHGTVSAEVVVRATEAYTPDFAEYRRALVPLYSLVVATEPLAQSLREETGLIHRMAFNDMRHLRIYAQATSDGRLVFGGRGAPYHFASKVSPAYDTHEGIHQRLVSTLREFFPALAGARVTHRWGGPLGVPRDWHPSVGFDRKAHLAWAGPYVGDGVATSNLAGRILRSLILGQDDELTALPLVNHRSPQWEREPFRWLGVNLGLRAASFGDFEERITGRPSKVAGLLEALTGAH